MFNKYSFHQLFCPIYIMQESSHDQIMKELCLLLALGPMSRVGRQHFFRACERKAKKQCKSTKKKEREKN
jgi:hypothetical protein